VDGPRGEVYGTDLQGVLQVANPSACFPGGLVQMGRNDGNQLEMPDPDHMPCAKIQKKTLFPLRDVAVRNRRCVKIVGFKNGPSPLIAVALQTVA